jgi:uncharacterized protein (DUF2336 family)
MHGVPERETASPDKTDQASLLDDLEASLASGNIQQRLKILQRVTDLFVVGSRRYSGAEIELFDDVLTRLATEIEIKARACLARTMARLDRAPPQLVRQLAFDDAIAVAAPVLVSTSQLSDADLIENASTKSQDHLYAIAQRIKLSEAVTDVLITRGDRRVVRRTVRNDGARISFAGYRQLVKRARNDEKLAISVGQRGDIPRQCFLKLLETASAKVREKLEAINPQATRAIRGAVADAAGSLQREAREASRRHAGAVRDARHLFRSHELSEANVHGPAQSQQFEKTAVALSMLGPFPIDLVERALIDKGSEMILILVRAAGCSWVTAKATLTMHAAGRGLSQQDLEAAAAAFERLTPATARRVVKFYEASTKPAVEGAIAHGSKTASTAPVDRRELQTAS